MMVGGVRLLSLSCVWTLWCCSAGLVCLHRISLCQWMIKGFCADAWHPRSGCRKAYPWKHCVVHAVCVRIHSQFLWTKQHPQYGKPEPKYVVWWARWQGPVMLDAKKEPTEEQEMEDRKKKKSNAYKKILIYVRVDSRRHHHTHYIT